MENCFCRDLTLPWEIDQTPLGRVQQSYTNFEQIGVFPFNAAELDSNFLKLLNTVGLRMSHGEMFYIPPNTQMPIHIDDAKLGTNRCKLNWVFGAAGSFMEWWRRNDESAPVNYQTTPIGTTYVLFDSSECTKIFSAKVHTPSLVNSGVPHSVNNCTDSGRWCMSFNLVYADSGSPIEWADAAELFKEFLV